MSFIDKQRLRPAHAVLMPLAACGEAHTPVIGASVLCARLVVGEKVAAIGGRSHMRAARGGGAQRR